jgi:2-phosphosulfolactate phosphatase
MSANLEVLFAPAEFAALRQRDLSGTTCVVFDILRATTSMTTALANGAREILPVEEISEALVLREKFPGALLAGERDGLRIRAAQAGSVDFDLGNSPREFTTEKVRGKSIIVTTTNGTRALKACDGAKKIYAGSFLGLSALASQIRNEAPSHLLIVCAGTFEEMAYEDTLAAGALCELIWPVEEGNKIADSAQIAREIFRAAKADMEAALKLSRNARRLLANPDLRDDVPFCFQRDAVDFVCEMITGIIRKCES